MDKILRLKKLALELGEYTLDEQMALFLKSAVELAVLQVTEATDNYTKKQETKKDV